MNHPARFWIDHLQLTHHIEGGSFREVYRSPLMATHSSPSQGLAGERNFSTSIYFLLEQGQFSAFHRILSDELWHFYAGDCLLIYEIDFNGELRIHRLGSDPGKEESFQIVIKAGNWFASAVVEHGEYALVGCTVSPGFDFADFELAKKEELMKKFPSHGELIKRFCR